MAEYCVNKNTGHEVHNIALGIVKGCLPDIANRMKLGNHLTCTTAVQKAHQTYATANGCFYCANACHTS